MTPPKQPIAAIGHNSPIAKSKLEGFIKRVEKLISERSDLNADIKLIMDEAKVAGFDKRTVRECIKLRAMDSEKRTSQEELRDLYLAALGLV